MYAAIDVGSNTIRMLLGVFHKGAILPYSYHREITRLSGNFSQQHGLSESGIQKSLSTLKSYKKLLSPHAVSHLRVVGTAALRRADNKQYFIDKVFSETGFVIEVIDGAEEALLTSKGALTAIKSSSESTLVVDIGGGSTELACSIDGRIRFQKSYTLGVVRLCEEFSSDIERQQQINAAFAQIADNIKSLGLSGEKYSLIGTAGTITTLAAIHLQLIKYDVAKINNHELSASWLKSIQQKLKLMTAPEREALVGMERGRGDLMLPGLQILLSLMEQLHLTSLRVSDSGLLEGVFLGLTDS